MLMIATDDVRLGTRSRFSRGAFAALGCVFVGLGAIGVFVPVWPTTIFCIGALWCFKKSSRRLEEWLLGNRYIGPALRDWDESRSITRRSKIIAIAAIWLSIAITLLMVAKPWVQALVLAIAVLVSVYIATRHTKEALPAQEAR
jgi:uncharacterized membrane protein YbaN (DUF454 family)